MINYAIRSLSWLDALNLLDVYNYYLVLTFLLSTGLRVRTYRSVVSLVFASPKRWPKLLELVRSHRTVFLGLPTLLAIGLLLILLLSNFLASHLVWVQARVSFEKLWGHLLPLVAVVIPGGLMLFLDGKAIFSAGHFDRAALEEDFDKAESWLQSWKAPALRVVTFGFVNPRKIVGVQVRSALVKANWVMVGGMWRLSLRSGMKLAFGLALWLTWALTLQ